MPKPTTDGDSRSYNTSNKSNGTKYSGSAPKNNQKPTTAKPISQQTTITPKTNKEKFFTYETQEEEQRFIHTYETAVDAKYYMLWIEELPKLEERIQILEWFHGIYNPSDINKEDIEVDEDE